MAERASGGTTDLSLRRMVRRLQERGILTVSSNATLTEAHDIIEVDTTSGAVTLTIAPEVADVKGHIYYINHHTGGNNVVLDARGSETIDGGATATFTGRRAYYASTSQWRRLY